MKYEIQIWVDNIERNFLVTREQLLEKDWNEVMEDMMDTMDSRHDPEEPSFKELVEQA